MLGVSKSAAAALGAIPAGLNDDSIIVPSYLLSAELSVGDRITVRTSTGSADFTVAAGALADQGLDGNSLVTTEAAWTGWPPPHRR